MKIYQITESGNAIASNPESNPSVARKVLYFMRRNKGMATDDQLVTFVEPDSGVLQKVLRELKNKHLVVTVGR